MRTWLRDTSGSSSTTVESIARPKTTSPSILNFCPGCGPSSTIKRAGPPLMTCSWVMRCLGCAKAVPSPEDRDDYRLELVTFYSGNPAHGHGYPQAMGLTRGERYAGLP